MRIITPLPVTPSNLTASNVAITETAWTAGTYTTGTQRYEGVTLYEVVASPSTTDQPSVGAAKDVPTWKVVGAINRYKMFDNVISSQSTRSGTIVVTIDPNQVVNAAAFFGLVGNTVNVVMTDPVEGVVYNQTKTLQDNILITDWYAYFFEGIYQLTDAVFTDLPSYLNATITATIDAGASSAACGEMVIGRQALALDRTFAGLVAQGVGLWMGFQAFINIGVNLGALPTKGLTLPFMSYGGSAILLNMVALAIVLRVDYENRQLMRGARA